MTRGGDIGVSRGESHLCLVLGDRYGYLEANSLYLAIRIMWLVVYKYMF